MANGASIASRLALLRFRKRAFLTALILTALSGSAADELGNFPDGKYATVVVRPESDFAHGLLDPISEADVRRTLQMFLDRHADSGRNEGHRLRVARLAAALRPMYVALPKAPDGRLTYQTARYLLHRYLLQTRGWFVRGLESSDGDFVHRSGVQSEWMPAYIQGLLVERSGKLTLDLDDVTVMVATLEDLIDLESDVLLKAIYRYLDIPVEGDASKPLAACAIDAFVYYSLMFDLVQNRAKYDPFRLPGNMTPEERRARLCDIQLLPRMQGYRASLDDWKASVLRVAGDSISFPKTASFAYRFRREHYKENEQDCDALRGALHTMAGEDGRVALQTYYDKRSFRFWNFNEDAEFLREVGILDSMGDVPTIVVPNYIGSRVNCIESSVLYAVCCKNKCDDLLSQLEIALAAPAASAAQIEAVVSRLSSNATLSSSEMSQTQRTRLQHLEVLLGGLVPIHSEAFAIWLNHVFPRACPQPHPDRSSKHPMTAGEWLHESGTSWVDEGRAQAASGASDFRAGADGVRSTMAVLSMICGLAWFSLSDDYLKLGKLSRSCTRVFKMLRACFACLAVSLAAVTILGVSSSISISMFFVLYIVREFMKLGLLSLHDKQRC
eukprot:TRINITY_DN22262_c0_g1_i1.p1 TRINITY_DN22262_c0_g1~~TRINITY_DN22262_c0_g1_i1.p1  ORF type:complete len:613 (-),score=96.79 TRINITY_DN22262_c0_g1_i1:157-1995(-)